MLSDDGSQAVARSCQVLAELLAGKSLALRLRNRLGGTAQRRAGLAAWSLCGLAAAVELTGPAGDAPLARAPEVALLAIARGWAGELA